MEVVLRLTMLAKRESLVSWVPTYNNKYRSQPWIRKNKFLLWLHQPPLLWLLSQLNLVLLLMKAGSWWNLGKSPIIMLNSPPRKLCLVKLPAILFLFLHVQMLLFICLRLV
ncbi:hypothetical protein NC653_007155 [Populus alba x Populus x berolinensis]|uniref:Uncharacterized protein n=1 Tax=Populus alba x Populus x berolinensis TaxID=444605 RepID=A0AAD6WD46_9ROSI|nr:hypothetical protein NC653_007155 [Populus alba x Populus x berolinensis]